MGCGRRRIGEEGGEGNACGYLRLLRQFARIELHLFLRNHEVEVVQEQELELQLVEFCKRKPTNLR